MIFLKNKTRVLSSFRFYVILEFLLQASSLYPDQSNGRRLDLCHRSQVLAWISCPSVDLGFLPNTLAPPDEGTVAQIPGRIGSTCTPLSSICETDKVGYFWHIAAEDRYFLEAFFRNLISINDGCYVLFGDKPASFAVYPDLLDISFCKPHSMRLFKRTLLERKGFEIWQKCQSLLPSEKYTILRAEMKSSNWAIFFIHKPRLLSVLQRDFDHFKKIFPEYPSPEALFNAMLNQPSVLGKLCSKHCFLLGIILGFGKDSAALFDRRNEIIDFLYPSNYGLFDGENEVFVCPDDCKSEKQYRIMGPRPSAGFHSLREELEAIEKKAGSVILPEEGLREFWLHLPLGFLVDTTQVDLEELRAKYRLQRVQATSAYQGNYLETTLKALSQ